MILINKELVCGNIKFTRFEIFIEFLNSTKNASLSNLIDIYILGTFYILIKNYLINLIFFHPHMLGQQCCNPHYLLPTAERQSSHYFFASQNFHLLNFQLFKSCHFTDVKRKSKSHQLIHQPFGPKT